MGQRGGEKKEPKKRGKKLIAAFCSAINDDEGLEGRETFRWLREDVLRCPLSPPRHTSSTPFPVSPLRLFPISPSFFAKLSVTLDNNNSNEGDDDDDRPANGIKGKNILGAPRKRLRCLYTLQSAPFGRSLASES